MNYPKQLIIVRHAESLRNVKKRGVFFRNQAEKTALGELSDEETPLTNRGIEQARQTGVALRKAYGLFDAVFHSGYRRTMETAQYIIESYENNHAKMKSRVFSDILLRERTGGYTRNMLINEVRTHFPWREKYWDESHPALAVPPGGESVADVCTRASAFLLRLRLDYPGKKVLVISHERVINAFRMINEGLSFEEILPILENDSTYCGVTDYMYNPIRKKLVLRRYNTTYWKEK